MMASDLDLKQADFAWNVSKTIELNDSPMVAIEVLSRLENEVCALMKYGDYEKAADKARSAYHMAHATILHHVENFKRPEHRLSTLLTSLTVLLHELGNKTELTFSRTVFLTESKAILQALIEQTPVYTSMTFVLRHCMDILRRLPIEEC